MIKIGLTVFGIIVIAAVIIAVFGPLFKWGLKVIKDLKNKKEEG